MPSRITGGTCLFLVLLFCFLNLVPALFNSWPGSDSDNGLPLVGKDGASTVNCVRVGCSGMFEANDLL